MTETRATQTFRASALRFSGIAPPGAFRLLLAFAVVLSHISRFDVGRLGVLLFFFLSGYWTARIWAEKFDSRRWGRFYLARYWRIAPLFLLATLAAAWIRGWDLRLPNFTLLGIASTSATDPTGVSWSLDVELQFYLLVPLIIGALGRAPVAAVIACLPLTALGWWMGDRFGVVTVLKYLPTFVLGVLTFARAWKPGVRTAYVSLAAFAGMTLITAATPFMLSTVPNPFDQDIWCFLWMLPLLPYVAHSLTVRSSRLDRNLGNLSYPLYLVHFAAIAVLQEAFGDSLAVKAAAVGLSVVVAVAAYIWVDRPIDRRRVRVTES